MVVENWLRIDEADDVFGSVRHCLACYELVCFDQHVWKWIALATHSAIQGAAVCHLTGTSGIGALTDKNTIERLRYFEASRTDAGIPAPSEKLAAFPELLKRIRKPNSAGDRSNAIGISLTDVEFEWANRIHESVRNQFAHFAPMSWALDVSGLPSFTRLGVRIVREIAEVGRAFRRKDELWLTALLAHLTALEKQINPSLPVGPPTTS